MSCEFELYSKEPGLYQASLELREIEAIAAQHLEIELTPNSHTVPETYFWGMREKWWFFHVVPVPFAPCPARAVCVLGVR